MRDDRDDRDGNDHIDQTDHIDLTDRTDLTEQAGAKRFTPSDIMALKPCWFYPERQVAELFYGRESMTLEEILSCERACPEDRLWIATRPGMIAPHILIKWANKMANQAVQIYYLRCGVSEAERWAKAWLDGSDRSLRAARAAVDAKNAASKAANAARANTFFTVDYAARILKEYRRQIAELLEIMREEAQ